MTKEVELPALEATNPLGFFAALGVLDVLHRSERAVTLRWTDELVPHAVVAGVESLDEVIEVADGDRERWRSSVLLAWPQEGALADLKPNPAQLRAWSKAVWADEDVAAADLFCGLVAEGAVDRSGKTKPTHLHFTAGQQRFLDMVRELASGVGPADLREGLEGPWRHASKLPSLSWDSRGERVFALRGFNPSKEKRMGVPGADWLAFLGLRFLPVANSKGNLVTTACDRGWKRSRLRWPVWAVPLSEPVILSLLCDPELVAEHREGRTVDVAHLAARGILQVLEARVRRSDQGGYGSFGAAETLVDARSLGFKDA